MYQVDINQAREQISKLLPAALNGDEIVFTQDSRPVLKLVRVEHGSVAIADQLRGRCRCQAITMSLFMISTSISDAVAA
jgi:antitoxin (DNA-binding transcriptional repressor) of toxin-antitoxin stability system